MRLQVPLHSLHEFPPRAVTLGQASWCTVIEAPAAAIANVQAVQHVCHDGKGMFCS
jgi:hypothetical protein